MPWPHGMVVHHCWIMPLNGSFTKKTINWERQNDTPSLDPFLHRFEAPSTAHVSWWGVCLSFKVKTWTSRDMVPTVARVVPPNKFHLYAATIAGSKPIQQPLALFPSNIWPSLNSMRSSKFRWSWLARLPVDELEPSHKNLTAKQQ